LGRLERERDRVVVVGNKRDLRTTLIMNEPLLEIEPQSAPKNSSRLSPPGPDMVTAEGSEPSADSALTEISLEEGAVLHSNLPGSTGINRTAVTESSAPLHSTSNPNAARFMDSPFVTQTSQVNVDPLRNLQLTQQSFEGVAVSLDKIDDPAIHAIIAKYLQCNPQAIISGISSSNPVVAPKNQVCESSKQTSVPIEARVSLAPQKTAEYRTAQPLPMEYRPQSTTIGQTPQTSDVQTKNNQVDRMVQQMELLLGRLNIGGNQDNGLRSTPLVRQTESESSHNDIITY